MWNFGSLLGVCLIIQLATGITLAMHYNPSVMEAFNSVEHIMRDVENGWLIRYLHSNTASAFFFLVYLHIGRGLYYGSYRAPRTLAWVLGSIILVLMIGTGFLGFWNIAQNEYNKIINTTINNTTTTNNTINNTTTDNMTITSLQSKCLSFLFLIKNYYTNSPTSFLPVKRRRFSTMFKRSYSTSLKPSARVSSFLKSKNLNPVFIYENLDQDDIKKKIAAETKGLSGIYMILNITTLNFYIGSASTNRFNSRFSSHLVYNTGSKVVKNAVKKYKLHNFAFIVLEIYPYIIDQINNKDLLDLEDFYIKSLLPDYNILTEAGSSFGYKHTEISRIKMKSSYSQERRDRIGDLNRGKTFSPETIESMRQSAIDRKEYYYSEEGILNMKNKSKPIIVKELNGIVYGIFPSITATAEALNCSAKTLSRALSSPSKLLKKRWVVNFVE
jgi:group I intron endonuclease